jgi:hypothetical protein
MNGHGCVLIKILNIGSGQEFVHEYGLLQSGRGNFENMKF